MKTAVWSGYTYYYAVYHIGLRFIEWDLLPFGLNRGSDADMRINYNDDLSNDDF